MKLLIIAATATEIMPFLKVMEQRAVNGIWTSAHNDNRNGDELVKSSSLSVSTLITGIGICATTYQLTKHLQSNRYDFMLQVGIAGSYNLQTPLGTLVFVKSEQFGDLGAEDDTRFLNVFDMGIAGIDELPYEAGKIVNQLNTQQYKLNLPQVKGLTVNTCSGNETTILMRNTKFGCDVESMEGAACHYISTMEGISFAQVRAISNYVTKRDKGSWKMKEAITMLNEWLIGYIDVMSKI